MPFFFFLGIVLAIADWIATARDASSVRWITKPGALLALLLWFATSSPVEGSLQTTWFTLALCLCLVGDIFLLMEGHQLIKGGLAFILAHIAFIVAYNTPLQIPAIFLVIFIVNVIPTIHFFRKILKKIRTTGDNDLVIGVSIYALALTSMTSTAISTLFRIGWPPFAAWLTAIGALLVYISDLFLFSKHFLEVKPPVKVLTMVTYHFGQFALAYGFLWFLYS
jgi:alkenylglycerophosphocholine/alkenylglycerophosphoethanolamine hydrolase